jgi:DNA-binding CsgD family transcriptional regulator
MVVSGHLSSGDVGALLRLVGEAREHLRVGQSATEHVLRGLMRLTRSEVAAEIEATGLGSPVRPPRVLSVFDCGWATSADRARLYDHYLSSPVLDDPFVGAHLREPHRLLTLTGSEVLSPAEQERSFLSNELHRPASLGDSLVSFRSAEHPEAVHMLVLKRASSDSPFSGHDRDLVHLLVSECAWVFEPPRGSVVPSAGLSPREQQTLALLMTPASEKQIAAKLGISRHTAHGYIKLLYRKLAVTSRAELMARGIEPGRQSAS